MTTLTLTSRASAASAASSCIMRTSRKPRRVLPLQVRFCPQPSVMYTYSQADYDRSGLFPENPSISKLSYPPKPILLTVSVNFMPTSKSHPTATSSHTIRKKKMLQRPRLTIDTSNLHGPLFFTNMTTHHEKKEKFDYEDSDILTDKEDEEWVLTRENTRRNSLLSL
ncbi:hypothetical protein BDF14DRAFT_1740767 [Spinellus fusiger]|nr:hypothetical protein BDF14DRAFT_1740767 [Spinellus fusiger]